MTSMNTATLTRSTRVVGSSPRASSRMRHSNRLVATMNTAKASRSESCVSRPSKRWVNSSTGMRRIEGQGPK